MSSEGHGRGGYKVGEVDDKVPSKHSELDNANRMILDLWTHTVADTSHLAVSSPPRLTSPSTRPSSVSTLSLRFVRANIDSFLVNTEAHPDFEYTAVARWFAHIKSYEAEHSALPGDASASAGLFGGASSSAPAAKAAEPAEEDDDEVDLFGSDDEDDAETERIKAERVAEYQAKKAAKLADKGPGPVAKSIVTLQVKPWDDETDMEALEKSVRSIEKDGLGKSSWIYGARSGR